MLQISIPGDAKTRSCLCSSVFPTASILLLVFFFATTVLVPDHKQPVVQVLTRSDAVDSFSNLNSTTDSQDQERPRGSETLTGSSGDVVDSVPNLKSTTNFQEQERPQEKETLNKPEGVDTIPNLKPNTNFQEQERPQESETLNKPEAVDTIPNLKSNTNFQEPERPQGSETLNKPAAVYSLPNLKPTTNFQDQERPQGSETLRRPAAVDSIPNPKPTTNFQEPERPQGSETLTRPEAVDSIPTNNCQDQERPQGSETLPEGIVKRTSNLQMRPLWGDVPRRKPNEPAPNLFAAAVGIKQKDLVNKMVTKFLASSFTVMLFHYDGAVEQWSEFDWSSNVIHVSARNQTKWWFAKRFMHPDIVVDYGYIFLWDEDIGVDFFDPLRYVSIVASEGLEISQPALDIRQSEIHQQITGRSNSKSLVHRRIYKQGSCDASSTAPPCTGWVEMMTPVFSRDAWRCVWHMVQNDLIHAWGLDYRLGYCAQGDRTQKMGVVDAEYVVHYGRPTLGEPVKKDPAQQQHRNPRELNPRVEVRRQSWNEYKTFKRRWAKAAEDDKCWIDPYRDDDSH